MAGAMAMWVRDVGVDGYRADVAGYVPPDFWVRGEARPQRDQAGVDARRIQPSRPAHDRLRQQLRLGLGRSGIKIGKGEADTGALYGFYSENESAWPTGAQRMIFTSNHDENAWKGTEFELFGPALPNAFALLFTSEGIPLIYNGQEAGNDRRLKFFEKDPIVWKDHPHAALIRDWIAFRKAHPALDNAPWGARMVQVKNSDNPKVFSFVRAKDGDAVFVIQNYSAEPQDGDARGGCRIPAAGPRKAAAATDLAKGASLSLPPWSTRVFTRAVR